MNKRSQRKLDLVCIGILSVAILMLISFLLGFMEFGLNAPMSYYGGDDFTSAANCRSLRINGWTWFNEMLGAPFGQDATSLPYTFTSNFDLCVEKILSFLFKNPFAALNAFYLLIFPMCAISAFFTLRGIGINRGIAIFGAILFSCAPYIFARSVSHIVLSACFFVPFSILLCVWSVREDDSFLTFKKGSWKYKKNIIAIALCFLIANNGLGYYQIFSCYFLLITALYSAGRERRISAAKKPCILIGFITAFFALNVVVPYVVNILINGNSSGSVNRSLADGEVYGLKVVQLFLPLNAHGISFLERLINAYNSNMPLVNENSSAYLGIGAAIGFLLSLLVLFFPDKKDSSGNVLRLFAQLNLWAVLFGTVGGFSSIVALLGFRFLRSSNRISIFISFISICVLCIFIQGLYQRIREKKPGKGCLVGIVLISTLFTFVCLYDIMPTYGANDGRLAANAKAYEADHRFISSIDNLRDEGDMIYQLPYQSYPEAGAQNNMSDYQHLTGYLHSEKLKWSYGSVRGSYGDKWQRVLSEIPIQNRIDFLVSAGYKGIYIDARAYTPEALNDLCAAIEMIAKVSPVVSENGNLFFYDLRPYISAHPEFLEASVPTLEELVANRVYTGGSLPFFKAEKIAGTDSLLIHPGGDQYGPYIFLIAGNYRVIITGKNLDRADYDAICPDTQIEMRQIERDKNRIVYEFLLEKDVSNVEFRLFNTSGEDVELDYIEIYITNE